MKSVHAPLRPHSKRRSRIPLPPSSTTLPRIRAEVAVTCVAESVVTVGLTGASSTDKRHVPPVASIDQPIRPSCQRIFHQVLPVGVRWTALHHPYVAIAFPADWITTGARSGTGSNIESLRTGLHYLNSAVDRYTARPSSEGIQRCAGRDPGAEQQEWSLREAFPPTRGICNWATELFVGFHC